MVGWPRRTAEVFLAETGADMTRFATAQQLASWSRMCPGNAQSAGKHRPVTKKPGKTWLGGALLEAAHAAIHTDSYLAAYYRRIARRRGPNKAAVAVAHSMVVTAWHMLTSGEPYVDPGADYFQRRRDPERECRHLVHQLQALGYSVSLSPAA
jgi:transposase